MGSCGAKGEACNGRLPSAWEDVGRFLTSGFWTKRVVCAFCVDHGRFNQTQLKYALLGKGNANERLVISWAVTKAGSRRRRGYNVDSSWTEAALSPWLVPDGRSAS